MQKFGILALLLSWTSIAGAQVPNCESADPKSSLLGIRGDLELTVDPDDPTGKLVYVNHVMDGRSQVVVAHLDGVSGIVLPGTVTTIADNFQGQRRINGPEFVHPPGRGLGILYHAPDGVHGIFRPVSPRAWNDFTIDVDGAAAGPNPPRLKSSYRGAYETSDLPFGQDTYTLKLGPCSDRCFAKMSSGVPTDVGRVLARHGLAVRQNFLIQGVRDTSVLVKACTRRGGGSGGCGLYEVAIDGAGRLVDDSPQRLASLLPQVGPLVVYHPMSVARHPVTGTTVLFLAAAHQTGKTIDVYEQSASGGAFALIGSAPVRESEHYRVVNDGHSLILSYVVLDGNARGTYTLPVTAEQGRLVIGQSKQVLPKTAADVIYLPAAGKLAVYFKAEQYPYLLQRCFFQP